MSDQRSGRTVKVLAVSDEADAITPPPDVSAYLLTEPRILREVCQSIRGDDEGRRCPECCVREFCESQARRAGKLGKTAVSPVRPGRGSA